MASDRRAAKQGVKSHEDVDSELDAVLRGGHELQLKIAQEANRHAAEMRRVDLGFIGKALGGEATAPTMIAFIAMFFGLIVATGCYIGAAIDNADFWSKNAERALAFSSAALAFIFGKSAK